MTTAPDLDQRLAFARQWADASPFYAQLHIAVDELTEAQAALRLDASDVHHNADGIVHGGVLPALADAAMGSALRTVHGPAAQLMAVESNLRYVRPASGGTLHAYGRVVQAHRNVAFTEVEIADEAGHLLARGGATFLLRFDDS